MLIHDDIIDKSDKRRGKPAMHALLRNSLIQNNKIKFNGEDLAIVVGDVMYAMALDAFLAIRENLRRKESALKKLFLAALYTGSGEFIELLLGIKKIEKVAKTDKKEAGKILSSAFQTIDKAAKRGIIKKNNAARKKSRLSRLVR